MAGSNAAHNGESRVGRLARLDETLKLRNEPNPMIKLTDPIARCLAATTFLAVTVVATPSLAQTSPPGTMLAQAAPQAPAGQPAARARTSRVDRVETRIKQLHDQLHITAAQEPQWNGVAQAMRDDAASMQAVIAKRRQNRGQMSAVDDLRSYEEVAETHVAGLQKLIPAFQALYDTMSPEQKKNADTAFSRQGRRRAAAKAPQQ